MPQTSPFLDLPYIQPAQAQKHVTHNEALEVLDAVVHLSVVSRTTPQPPDPATASGARYIVPVDALGDWADQPAGTLAIAQTAGWMYLVPRTGWLAHVQDTDGLVVYGTAGWAAPESAALDLQNTAGLGIGASWDATNRLSVASPATLLSHAGSDHRMVINKAAPADTASMVFQSTWSGRAEMGLAGDDRFRLKVSADNATYHTALQADPASGKVIFPSGAEVSQTLNTPQGDYVQFACGVMVAQLRIPLGRGSEFGSGTLADMYRSGFRDVVFDHAFTAPPTVTLTAQCGEVSGLHKCITLSFRAATPAMINDLQACRSTVGTADITAHVTAHGRWR